MGRGHRSVLSGEPFVAMVQTAGLRVLLEHSQGLLRHAFGLSGHDLRRYSAQRQPLVRISALHMHNDLRSTLAIIGTRRDARYLQVSNR